MAYLNYYARAKENTANSQKSTLGFNSECDRAPSVRLNVSWLQPEDTGRTIQNTAQQQSLNTIQK
jgi:hypothetical protein